MAAYFLDFAGVNDVLLDYMCSSVAQSILYDDRSTAIAWGGQILAALRDYAARFDGHPPASLITADRNISRGLAHYVARMDLDIDGIDGGDGHG